MNDISDSLIIRGNKWRKGL